MPIKVGLSDCGGTGKGLLMWILEKECNLTAIPSFA